MKRLWLLKFTELHALVCSHFTRTLEQLEGQPGPDAVKFRYTAEVIQNFTVGHDVVVLQVDQFHYIKICCNWNQKCFLQPVPGASATMRGRVTKYSGVELAFGPQEWFYLLVPEWMTIVVFAEINNHDISELFRSYSASGSRQNIWNGMSWYRAWLCVWYSVLNGCVRRDSTIFLSLQLNWVSQLQAACFHWEQMLQGTDGKGYLWLLPVPDVVKCARMSCTLACQRGIGTEPTWLTCIHTVPGPVKSF